MCSTTVTLYNNNVYPINLRFIGTLGILNHLTIFYINILKNLWRWSKQ